MQKAEKGCARGQLAEQPPGYATLCAFDRVFPPHPDPLPQSLSRPTGEGGRRPGEGLGVGEGEGTAGV